MVSTPRHHSGNGSNGGWASARAGTVRGVSAHEHLVTEVSSDEGGLQWAMSMDDRKAANDWTTPSEYDSSASP